MHTVSVILSSTPNHGWSTEQSDEYSQRGFALFPEFVNYVREKKWDALKLAILCYSSQEVDIPDLRIEDIPVGQRFCISQDPDGIERIVFLEYTTEWMDAFEFRM